MINKVIEELLNIHCINCHGKTFGCKGCTKEEQIKAILEPIVNIKQTKKKTTKKE